MKSNKLLLIASTLVLFFLAIACGSESPQEKEVATPAPEKEVAEKQPRKKMSEGDRLFLLCQACHSLEEGEAHKTGPNLHDLFGKKAGTAEGYANYSDAIKNSGIVWDETQLKNWLAKPTDFLPGTSMAFIGIEDEAKQQVLIDYLKEKTK